jgi:hypothetical protein
MSPLSRKGRRKTIVLFDVETAKQKALLHVGASRFFRNSSNGTGFSLNQILQKKMGGANPNPFLGHQIHIFIED